MLPSNRSDSMTVAFSGKCQPLGADPRAHTDFPQEMRLQFNLREERSGRFRLGTLALSIAVALGAVAAAGLLDARNVAMADWRHAPWCAYLGGRDGGYDC